MHSLSEEVLLVYVVNLIWYNCHGPFIGTVVNLIWYYCLQSLYWYCCESDMILFSTVRILVLLWIWYDTIVYSPYIGTVVNLIWYSCLQSLYWNCCESDMILLSTVLILVLLWIWYDTVDTVPLGWKICLTWRVVLIH